MTLLSDLITARRELSKEDFFETWFMPILLHRVEHLGIEERSFNTGITEPKVNPLDIEQSLANNLELTVLKVVKRPGAPFKDRISVGRSRNSDIHIDYPKVSKLHAHFTWNEEKSEYLLTDANSTNGTFVNSTRLTPNNPANIADRDLISFGRYHFRFHLPESLYQLLGEIVNVA